MPALRMPSQHHPAARPGVQLPGGPGRIQHRPAGRQPDPSACRPWRAQPLIVGGRHHHALLQQAAKPGTEGAHDPRSGGGAPVGQAAGPVPPHHHRPATGRGRTRQRDHYPGHGDVAAVEVAGVVQDRPGAAVGDHRRPGDRQGADQRARWTGRQRVGHGVELVGWPLGGGGRRHAPAGTGPVGPSAGAGGQQQQTDRGRQPGGATATAAHLPPASQPARGRRDGSSRRRPRTGGSAGLLRGRRRRSQAHVKGRASDRGGRGAPPTGRGQRERRRRLDLLQPEVGHEPLPTAGGQPGQHLLQFGDVPGDDGEQLNASWEWLRVLVAEVHGQVS
jgi:hypothetical protein